MILSLTWYIEPLHEQDGLISCSIHWIKLRYESNVIRTLRMRTSIPTSDSEEGDFSFSLRRSCFFNTSWLGLSRLKETPWVIILNTHINFRTGSRYRHILAPCRIQIIDEPLQQDQPQAPNYPIMQISAIFSGAWSLSRIARSYWYWKPQDRIIFHSPSTQNAPFIFFLFSRVRQLKCNAWWHDIFFHETKKYGLWMHRRPITEFCSPPVRCDLALSCRDSHITQMSDVSAWWIDHLETLDLQIPVTSPCSDAAL